MPLNYADTFPASSVLTHPLLFSASYTYMEVFAPCILLSFQYKLHCWCKNIALNELLESSVWQVMQAKGKMACASVGSINKESKTRRKMNGQTEKTLALRKMQADI